MFVKINKSFRHWVRGHVYNVPDGQANLLIDRTIATEVNPPAEEAVSLPFDSSAGGSSTPKRKRGRPRKKAD